MLILFKNINELVQIRDKGILKVSGAAMKILPSIKNAYLIVKNELIHDFGLMENCPDLNFDEIIDATGKTILPTWCDSHTHIVYAGNRTQEFVDRINGLSYEEIANRGGGILNSAKKIQETIDEEIYNQSKIRLEDVIKLGTGAIEIKSGYGLTTESEIKLLRIIEKLKTNYSVEIKSTFLGAHAFPTAFKTDKDGYVNLIISEMIPKIAELKLANFIDVFCEDGYFNLEQTDKILKAGLKFGMTPKIHVNQFNAFGGIQIAVQNQALSVDHLEILNDQDLEALKNSATIAVALPTCSFYLGIPYTPARKIIDSGLSLALASDFNPGSTPSGNMNFVVAIACIKMKMTPEEAINAATLNGAFAMGISETHGSITIGKVASLIVTKNINSFYQIPYEFGSNLIETVYIRGQKIELS